MNQRSREYIVGRRVKACNEEDSKFGQTTCILLHIKMKKVLGAIPAHEL